jgi:hypothetical protein
LAQVDRQIVGLRETQVEVRDLIPLLLMVVAEVEQILLVQLLVLAVRVSDLKVALAPRALPQIRFKRDPMG